MEFKFNGTIKDASHEYFKQGQLGFQKAGDTEEAFFQGCIWHKRNSKSKEMLEMLKDIKDYLGSDKREEVEQLIKQATEL